MNTHSPNSISLCAPVSGWVIPLEAVSDDVFSRKLLGDGVALVPEEGRLYAPVDGVVDSIFPSLHAYTFTTREGLQVLVHVGLGTIGLAGEGFRCFVKPGDALQAGTPIGEVDLTLRKARGLDPVTMLILCEGAEEMTMSTASGCVNGGEDRIVTLNCNR